MGGIGKKEDTMDILVNTDSNIDGHEELTTHVESMVEGALSRISDQITRVEVHLSDQNGDKSGQHDKRCMMEAHPKGLRPTAVTHQAASLGEAVDGAAGKLQRSLETTLEKRDDVR
jgi:ribosome-associated translation inhibitor RaiA